MARRSRKTSAVSTLQIMAAMIILLVVLVMMAYMLAPQKPEAPPVSAISYAEPPAERRTGPPEPTVEVTNAPLPSATGESPLLEAEPPLEEGPVFLIGGVVKDQHTGEPVPGAKIYLQRERNAEESEAFRQRNIDLRLSGDSADLEALLADERQSTAQQGVSTDARGRFSSVWNMAGTYSVQVFKPGYIPEASIKVVLDKERPVNRLDIKLSTGARVMGRVTEAGTSSGAPDLAIRMEGGVLATTLETTGRPLYYLRTELPKTDENGNYVFSGLSPGEYTLTVDVSNSPYRLGKELPFKKIMITQPDQELRGIDFTVDPAGIVWGYVVTPKNEPIHRANVLLCSSDSVLSQALTAAVRRAPPISSNSEEDGYYELLGVPLNEQWRVYATSEDYSPQLADPFVLTSAQRSVRIDIYLFSGSIVTGRVIEPGGTPIPEAEVVCIPSFSSLFTPLDRPQAFRNTRTDANGLFTITELPAGNYQVFARKARYKLAATGEPIYPNGYSDVKNVTVVLHPVATGTHAIFGVVFDRSNNAIGGASVSLDGLGMESFENIQMSTSTDSGGNFRFDNVETGTYRLTVSKEGFSPRSLSRVMIDRENRIVLDTSSLVRGQVLVRESNRPPDPPFRVSATQIASEEGDGMLARLGGLVGPSTSQTFQTPDGRFELFLEPGVQRLEAYAAALTPGRTEIVVAPGEQVDGVVIYISERGGTIEGRVTTRDRGNPQGAQVYLVEGGEMAEAALLAVMAGGGGEGRSQQVGDDGIFSFANLPGGDYMLIVQHPSYPTTQSDPIALDAQGNVTGIEIELGSGGGLEGYVYRNGRAVPNAVVFLVGQGTTENATTDNSGFYQIERLAAGEYQVMVAPIGGGDITGLYSAQGDQVYIEEGRSTRHDFGAGAGARIEGRCIPAPRLMGMAALRPPGMPPMQLGDAAIMNRLPGRTTGINPLDGSFLFEDVLAGEWELDIYYIVGGFDLRYVHTEPILIEGEEVVPVDIAVQLE